MCLMNKYQFFIVSWLACAGLPCITAQTNPNYVPPSEVAPPPPSQPSYTDLITEGNALMKAGHFEEATAKANQAIQMDGNNFKGYALRAFILSKQGSPAEAKAFLEMAITHAPADKMDKLNDQLKEIESAMAGNNAPTAQPVAARSTEGPASAETILTRIRAQLEFSNDTDWSAVEPLVSKVLADPEVQSRVTGARIATGPEGAALSQAVDASAPSSQIKHLLAKYLAANQLRDLTSAQSDLLAVLTTRQEAIATLMGLIHTPISIASSTSATAQHLTSDIIKVPSADELLASAGGVVGARIYEDDCAKCHGDFGTGNTKMGKKLGVRNYVLVDVQNSFTDDQAFQAIKEGLVIEGKTVMKPFELSDQDIKAVVARMRFFKGIGFLYPK
jgi:mono/diheme cytochrome c family protein/thioredoxin-like negative regulator of GroEL